MIDAYRELGYDIFELPPGAKSPPPVGWQKLASATREVPPGWNHGVSTEKFGVLDFDDIDLAREFYRTRRDIITTLVKTPKGLHAYFSGQLHNAQRGTFDVRGVGGYVVGAGSVVDEKKYEFVPGHELVPITQLKPFPVDFIPERKEGHTVITRGAVEHLDAYLATIESVQGQSGSRGLVRAAAVCRDEGLSEAETVLKLQWWNSLPVVSPKWSDRELARAATNVFKKGAKSA